MTRALATLLVILAVVPGAQGAGDGFITGKVVVNPLSVSLDASGTVSVGGSTTALATVRNGGQAPLRDVAVSLAADVNLVIARGATQTIPTLGGNVSVFVAWDLCPLAAGRYVVTATATAGAFTATSTAQVLVVSFGSGRCAKSASATLPAGGTLSTDREGDGATPASPVETAVTTPVAGTVSIGQTYRSVPPTAFSFYGQVVEISAPTATAAHPLRIDFRLDASLGAKAATVAVFRNAAEVPTCTGAAGAVPDPCVSSRATLAGGDVELVVLTSRASTWTFGAPIVRRGGVGALLTTSNKHTVAVLTGSDGTTVVGAFAFDAFRSIAATALAVSGRTAWFAGLGTDGRPFLAYAEDNGPNGHGDVFRLWIGGVEQTTDGKLAKGDVAITG
jgi:hypothetical protein